MVLFFCIKWPAFNFIRFNDIFCLGSTLTFTLVLFFLPKIDSTYLFQFLSFTNFQGYVIYVKFLSLFFKDYQFNYGVAFNLPKDYSRAFKKIVIIF
jgi:hypothetical protein